MPLVSIIMATRNTAPYLHDCLDSICAQTYPNWELIAINDHSTDGSLEILESYASQDKRIKVVNSKRELLIPALKEGYPHATGSLINRMDSDDKMPVDKIESMVAEWQKWGRGHIIAGGTKHFVDEGEVGGGFLRYEQWLNEVARNNLHWKEIYKECVIPSHCWLIHRDDLESAGGFEPEVYPEDYDLCFRFYQKGLKVIGMDKILHLWRDRSNRISRTWEEYKDNRYYQLKLRYFFEIDREYSRPLVIWGAGKNGKDLMKVVLKYEQNPCWICDNERKIGKDIYGTTLKHYSQVREMEDPQVLIAVASPDGQVEIEQQLNDWGMTKAVNYWFM